MVSRLVRGTAVLLATATTAACSAAGTVAAPSAATSSVGGSAPASGPAAGSDRGTTDALTAAVRGLAADLLAGRAPGPEVIDPAASDWSRRLAARATAMRAVGVDLYRLDVDPGTVRVSGDRASFTAVGEYRLRGAGPAPAPTTLGLTAHMLPGGWRLAGEQDAASLPEPWDLPGVRRTDRGGVVVVGDADADQLAWYADAAARAWSTTVAAAWPRRPAGSPVVVLPRTPAEFAAQVRATGRDVSGIAALTVGSLQAGRTSRGDVVVINPAARSRLTEAGRRTILAHELVHVAVRGTTTHTVPLWLTEGFAVQASWAGGGPPEQLRARARAWPAGVRTPAALPSDADLTGPALAQAYDLSALLVEDLVRRRGRGRVVAFYEAAAAGEPAERAASRTLGEDVPTILEHWRRSLAALG